jgi:hypothetical protein
MTGITSNLTFNYSTVEMWRLRGERNERRILTINILIGDVLCESKYAFICSKNIMLA